MNRGLYTDQIDLILRSNARTKHPYEGTFPSDKLETISVHKYPSCYIVNSDKSTKPGRHWLCVYVSSPSRINFFDSYALDLPNYSDIDKFVHRIGGDGATIYSLSGTPLQSDFSDVCGHWCIAFADLLSSGVQFNEFIKIFDTSIDISGTYDDFVRAYVVSDFCNSQQCNVNQLKSKKSQQRCVCKYLACCT